MAISTFLRAAFLIGTASSTMLRADDVLHRPYMSLAVSSSPEELERRADMAAMNSTADGVAVNPDGTLDIKAWDEMTGKACVESLSHLSHSSNPTGNCICYNLPALDAKNGTFEAEIRLYHISEARDKWATVPEADIKVSVSYRGASVSTVKKNVGSGPDMSSKSSTSTRRTLTARDDANGPKLLQSYMLVGRIDPAKLSENISMSDLEALVLPTLTLKANTPTGSEVTTNVSLNEAAFLTGVFSQQTVQSDFSAALAAVNKKVDELHNGTNAFILPGTQILILPIGTIITSFWLLVAISMYSYGTYERIQYAKSYQQRLVAGSAPASKTF